MEFLSFDPSSKTLSLKKGPIPKPASNEVLVKVGYAGICGTDLHVLEGSFPCKNGIFTPGHEFSGTIEALGSDVTFFKVGQKVSMDPNSGCGVCNHCHTGNPHLCKTGSIHSSIGMFSNGGWATYVVVPEKQIYVLPDGIDLAQGVLSEPLSCLAHGWDKINPVPVGTRVILMGAGIIGLLWAALFHLHGHRKTVTVSEPQAKRREMIKNLDVDYEAVSPSELKSREFDLAVDCSGSGPAMEAALSLLGPGGRLCVFGVASPQTKVAIEPFQVYVKELTIMGMIINPFTFSKGLALLKAMADRYLQYEKLGIKVYKLSEYQSALEALKRGDISKAVFKLS